jgi:hypothetical protein
MTDAMTLNGPRPVLAWRRRSEAALAPTLNRADEQDMTFRHMVNEAGA